jgi:transketolase
MNKALKEVLKDATPKQLESLTNGKDLRSIMDSFGASAPAGELFEKFGFSVDSILEKIK